MNVVNQNDSPRAKLRPPALKIVPNRVVGVVSVDMEEIDGIVLEQGECFVEQHPVEVDEAVTLLKQVGPEILVDADIVAGVRVSFPAIDAVDIADQIKGRGRLAKGRQGHAGFCPELDYQSRLVLLDQPHRKRHVTCPEGPVSDSLGWEEERPARFEHVQINRHISEASERLSPIHSCPIYFG